MISVRGLAEIVLWSHDINRSLDFYEGLFGLEPCSPAQNPVKFLQVSDGPGGVPAMVVLVPHPEPTAIFPEAKSDRTLHHLAFNVAPELFDDLRDRCLARGLEVRDGIHPVLKGVRTFYIDDPDGNEVECLSPMVAGIGNDSDPDSC